MISELAGIPNALGQEGGDSWRQPWHTSTLETQRVGGIPTFDTDQLTIANQNLWEERKKGVQRAVEDQSGVGIEALAWYVSFHDDQSSWGIYIPLSSLAFIDEIYFRRLTVDRDHRFRTAWSLLLHHEQMHFAVDQACAWFELMLRAPIRREFMMRFKKSSPLSAVTTSEAYLEVEETAANAHMLRQIGAAESRQIVAAVEKFVEKQPAGYRDGRKATGDIPFADCVTETLRSYLALWAMEHHLDIGSRAIDLSRLVLSENRRALSECPVYTLDDLGEVGIAPGSVYFIQCISQIVETENFARQFQRQDLAVRRDWLKKREQIKIGLPAPPRFEKLKNSDPPTWSLRLRSGHRVHLQPPDQGTNRWCAVAIGSHKEMGHG